MKKSILVLAAFGLLSVSNASAQVFVKNNRFISVGVSTGATNYYGDLSPGNSFISTAPALTGLSAGVFATKKFTSRLSARASFSWNRIKGDDAASSIGSEGENSGRLHRNLSFRNDVKELAVVGMFDIIPNFNSYLKRDTYQPYVFLGIGAFHQNPQTYYDGGLMESGWYDLQPLQTEGIKYHKVQMSIPFGFGMRYKLNSKMDLGFEFGWRKTFTDYLDDVSTKFADKGDLNTANGKAAWILADRSIEVDDLQNRVNMVKGNDGNLYPVAVGVSSEGSKRGSSEGADWYVVTGFSLIYHLDSKIISPKFR